MIWNGGEQLSWRPSGKNKIAENVEVDSKEGKIEEQMSGGEQLF